MKERIFESEVTCPCAARNDMEKCKDVLLFLEDLYEEVDTCDWHRYDNADLECAFCLSKLAIEVAKANKEKYNSKRLAILIEMKNKITEILLERALDLFRQLMKEL